MTASVLWVGFTCLIVMIALWVAYRYGKADQKYEAAEAATKRAKEHHNISEDVAGMSDDELDNRLRKHQ